MDRAWRALLAGPARAAGGAGGAGGGACWRRAVDVREELDRLSAHIAAARQLLHEGAGVGRRFDFLVQEFVREVNTLCSKSASVPLTATGLKLKAVIEQMREQVQNVE